MNKDVFKAFNPAGWIATSLALCLCLVLGVFAVNLLAYESDGCFRQIYDPDYCGFYTITHIPTAVANSAPSTSPRPTEYSIPGDSEHVAPGYQLLIRYTVQDAQLSLDRLTAGAFCTEFEAEPNLQSSCWEKIPLDAGNYYVFLSRESAEAAYDLLTNHPDQHVEFTVPIVRNPNLSSWIVQGERAIIRQLTDSQQARVDQVVLTTFVVAVAGIILIIFLWKKFVFNAVRYELYSSLTYEYEHSQDFS